MFEILLQYFHLNVTLYITVSDLAEKRQILRQGLTDQFEISEEYQQLELLAALYESSDGDLIKSAVRQINLKETPLGSHAAHIVSSIMSNCDELDLLNLSECGIDDELLGVMSENLKGKRILVSAPALMLFI